MTAGLRIGIQPLWPWVAPAAAWAMVIGSVALLGLDWSTFKPGRIEPIWVAAAVHVAGPIYAVVIFSVLAAFILSRYPGSRLGWTFAAVALLVAGILFGQEYSVRALVSAPGSLPGGDLAAWTATWAHTVMFGLGTVLMVLTFPDGRLPGWPWRVVASMAVVVTFGSLLGSLGDPGPLSLPFRDGAVPVTMPPALWNNGLILVGWPETALNWANVLVPTCAVALYLLRASRAEGDERLQLRWLGFALAVITVFGLVQVLADGQLSPWASDLNAQAVARWAQLGNGLTGWFVIPGSMAIAIFKYRLYGINVVISRSLVFGGLAIFITATYIGMVFGVGSLIGAQGGGGQVLALLGTAIVAVVFQPLHGWLSKVANRLVYGERHTPYDALSRFGSQAAMVYSTEEALPRLTRLLREATGAERAEAWLRVGGDLKREASEPSAAEIPALAVKNERLPALPDTDLAVPVREDGVLLGALAIAMHDGERVSSTDIRLLEDLASQTSLVLRNIRLVEELRASRERIVRAQDEERRRVERNLHDGAQQRLVALSLSLGRARAAEGTSARVAELLATTESELRTALAELRQLAQGIHPTILLTGGLEPALRSLAYRSPVPVTLNVSAGRLAVPLEATAYYTVSEALANVAKHAHASSVQVAVTASHGSLVIDVSDDGVGGAATVAGGGLQGLEDRTAAIGGTLAVESSKGRGTRVRVEIPCG